MALTKIDDRGLKTPIDLLDNEKIRFGTGNDLEVYHQNSQSYIDNHVGSLWIRGNGDHIFLQPVDGEYSVNAKANNAVELYYDNSKKLETGSDSVTITGHLKVAVNDGFDIGTDSTRWRDLYIDNAIDLKDHGIIRMGDSDDLQIYHDASHSRIKDAGTGYLIINTDTGVLIKNGADDEGIAYFTPNGAVELMYDNVKKLETTSSGVQITDNLGIGVAPSRELHVKGLDVALRLESTAATGRIGMEFYDTSAQKGFFGYPSSSNDHMAIQQNEAADLYFYVNGADRLRIDSSGRIAHHNSNIVTNGFGYHGWTGKTQILDSQGLAVFRADDAWGGSIQLASSRGNYASPSASLAGDRVGGIYFCAHDGTDLNSYTSSIESFVTGTVGSNTTPGYLTFSTANAGTNQVTERLRVQSGGGISFNGNSAAANALDSYEEGTWTPANTHLAITNNVTASYTKVGRLVTVQFDCTYASSPADTAAVGGTIDGLPFQPESSGFHFTPTFLNSAGNAIGDNESYGFLSYVEGSSNNRIILYSLSQGGVATRGLMAGTRVRATVTYFST